MKIKDIIQIIERDKWYKKQIELYKSMSGTANIGKVLEHNYKKWLELDIKLYNSECEVEND